MDAWTPKKLYCPHCGEKNGLTEKEHSGEYVPKTWLSICNEGRN